MTALTASVPAVSSAQRFVEWLAHLLDPHARRRLRAQRRDLDVGGSSRRTFLTRVALVATALSVDPIRYILHPVSAYAAVCGPDAGCGSGWTAFCCTINGGMNACPPDSFAAGWWKNDASSFCGGGARYIIDCNATCPTRCACRCSGSAGCDQRKTCCNQFRYGQCHQEIDCAGPVVCRIATCSPPWDFDPSCGPGSATDNRTSEHGAECLTPDNSQPPIADVFAFQAPDLGSTVGRTLARPLVGMATTPSGDGYWLVGADGAVFPFGDAVGYGSTAGTALNRPIVAMAATATGRGYWLVASDGGIFAYGDAGFFGSTGSIKLNEPIVGMAATRTANGYWLVASDGGIFAYGDAGFFGSTGSIKLNRPVVGMAATPSAQGYRLVASDGGVFAYGDASFLGSTGDIALNRPIVGMAGTATGRGYWLVASDGGVFAFGDAGFYGAVPAASLRAGTVVSMAAEPQPVPPPPTPSGVAPTTTTRQPGVPGYWIVARRT